MQRIQKIDIHAHVTPYAEYAPKYRTNGTAIPSPEALLELYGRLNIGSGVLLPIVSPEAQLLPMPTETCIAVAKAHPDRFLWFCNIDPRADGNRPDCDLGYLLEHYMSLGAKGVGELTAHLPADDPMIDNLFSYCEELGLPVTIHIAPRMGGYYGIIDELGLPRLDRMLEKHKRLKVLGHSQCFFSEIGENTDEIRATYPKGKATGGRLAELLRKHENLYCDLSARSGANALMRDREHAVRFIEEFSQRILYGCDICSPSDTFPFAFDDFLSSMRRSGEISEKNYVRLVRDNAVELLNLDPKETL